MRLPLPGGGLRRTGTVLPAAMPAKGVTKKKPPSRTGGTNYVALTRMHYHFYTGLLNPGFTKYSYHTNNRTLNEVNKNL